MTFRASSLATIASLHHAILNLVEVVGHHLEEVVNAVKDRRITMPQQVFLLLCELIIWAMDRERLAIAQWHLMAPCDEFILPFRHLIATPAHHGIFHY